MTWQELGDLDAAVPASFDQRPQEEYVRTAWSENPEILAAEETVRKARAGVAAAKTAYIRKLDHKLARKFTRNREIHYVRIRSLHGVVDSPG